MVKLTTMMGICVQALRCVLCGYVGIVVALVDLGNMLGTVRPRTHSDLIPWAQKNRIRIM